MSIGLWVIGRELGVTGRNASRYFVWRVCKACQKGSWIRKDNFREICASCSFKQMRASIDQKGERNPHWRGGKTRTGPYIAVRMHPEDEFYLMARANGYVLEHRLVMAKKLGRCLAPSECIHHIDGNTLNNVETNLELTNAKQHELSYDDGYKRGFAAGRKSRVRLLETVIESLKKENSRLRDLVQMKLWEGQNESD